MRSFLFEPWDRSRKASWLLLLATAVIAVVIGSLVWHALRSTAAPTASTAPAAAGGAIQLMGDPQAFRSGAPGVHVLFIGNSLTAEWDLPELVKRIAATDTVSPARLLVAEYAPPGARLSQALQHPALRRLLSGVRWDVVVLQEQSQVGAGDDSTGVGMRSAVADLTELIRRDGAVPLLYETWGWRNGDPNIAGDSYSAMQARAADNYRHVAAHLRVDVAPVGDAFRYALGLRPSIRLWAPDGNHANLAGAYLAASVLSSEIRYAESRDTQMPRVGASSYTAGLPPAQAAWLQRTAGEFVRAAAPSRGRTQ